MTKSEAKLRIKKLRAEIEHHRYLYHVLDKQEISDAALDSLKAELQNLENDFPEFITPDSPTQRVGGMPLPQFTKAPHNAPMISLTDAFASDEVAAWQTRNEKIIGTIRCGYFAELKMDGLALSLTYVDGVLRRAATRGDGRIGEDVTQNAKTIDAIPLRLREIPGVSLPKSVEVRGEVYMPKKVFDELNSRNTKEGIPLFANPRNAAAGAVRQLDSSVTKSRKLSFLAYDLVTNVGVALHSEVHTILSKLGFASGLQNQFCKNLDEVEEYRTRILKIRERLPFWVDGIVLTVNDLHLYQRLGSVGKTPRGAIAYKYPAEQATTIIEAIDVQIGRTGALTPVAHLKPVRVAGSTVSRATLHNADEIERLDVRIGDTVILEKAGDIIPDVVGVLKNLRNGKEKKFHMPSVCPVCGSKVTQKPKEVQHYCSNKHCFAQQQQALEHFVSKQAFDIDGLGPKILEQLSKADLVKDAADLFALTKEDIEPLERFAEKSADNLLQALRSAKTIELHRFINALGIRHVGEQTARLLAKHFGTLTKLQEATYDELIVVQEIGEVVARSIEAFFKDAQTKRLLHRLESNGVKALSERHIHHAGPFAGKRVVVTGTLESLSRDEAKQAIINAGGAWTSSVSSATDYVVVGENPGSKAKKAQKLGRPVISEEEFVRLLKLT
jgi:DNA ligase (NAD+)